MDYFTGSPNSITPALLIKQLTGPNLASPYFIADST